MYNDQPPIGQTSFSSGHTKGVVIAREDGGFWLIHSVPHYPPDPKDGDYSYPKTGLKNGQSYLCITLPAKELEIVGKIITIVLFELPRSDFLWFWISKYKY